MKIDFDNQSNLPALSESVNLVIDLFKKDDVDINELEVALKKDPGLSAQVLKIANSPFFGFSGSISSIKDACMILGLPTVYNLVTAAGIMEKFESDKGYIDFRLFWQHAFAKGVSVKVILEMCHQDETSAFITGLLRDTGKIMLDLYFPEVYEQVIKQAQSENMSFENTVKQITGKSEIDLTVMLLAHWNMPKDVVDAIKEQNHIVEKSSKLSCALHLSDFIVKGLNVGNNGGNYITGFYEIALNTLKLDYNRIEKIISGVDDAIVANPLP